MVLQADRLNFDQNRSIYVSHADGRVLCRHWSTWASLQAEDRTAVDSTVSQQLNVSSHSHLERQRQYVAEARLLNSLRVRTAEVAPSGLSPHIRPVTASFCRISAASPLPYWFLVHRVPPFFSTLPTTSYCARS